MKTLTCIGFPSISLLAFRYLIHSQVSIALAFQVPNTSQFQHQQAYQYNVDYSHTEGSFIVQQNRRRSSLSNSNSILLSYAHPNNLSPRNFGRSTTTSLLGFLPPSGGGDGDNKSQLSGIVSGVATLGLVVAFFLSPLGAIFFTVVNSLFVTALIIPIVAIVAFNIWQYFNTIEGGCPNCGAPVRVLKDSTPSICFNCGEIIQAKDDGIYIANPNQGGIFVDDFEKLSDEPDFIFSPWLKDLNGLRRPKTTSQVDDEGSARKTIIDVDVQRDEK